MPTVSFYLKNEDYDKWRSLEKPGEFIHNALSAKSFIAPNIIPDYPEFDVINPQTGQARVMEKAIKTPKDISLLNREDRQPISKSFSARKKK